VVEHQHRDVADVGVDGVAEPFRPIVRERFARRSLNVLPIENAKRPFVNNKS
jgi:hypothetical protein